VFSIGILCYLAWIFVKKNGLFILTLDHLKPRNPQLGEEVEEKKIEGEEGGEMVEEE